MTEYEFHQPVYSPKGEYLRTSGDTWEKIRWWFDACWDIAFPFDTTGCTYLDIGSAEGLYPLRFAQRGGVGLGINPESPYQNYSTAKLKRMYPEAKFEVIEGGLIKGIITPPVPPHDFVSCMNCLEYVDDPITALDSLFQHATRQVVVSTDIWLGPPKDISDGRYLPLLQKFVVEEFLAVCPWPTRVFILEFPYPELSQDQGFFISRANGDFSDLPETVKPFTPGGIHPTQQRYVQ